MNIKKRFELSLILALIFSILLSFCGFEASCKEIEKKLLRLHILANSDSVQDQELKLKVRDGVLEYSKELFLNAKTKQEAQQLAKEQLPKIIEYAQTIVNENGYSYTVTGEVKKAYFNTRIYNNFTLPAGMYDSVRLKIGKGKGKNWWCIMFPQVCISAATNLENSLSENATKTIKNSNQYKVKFKIVEWITYAREKIKF